MAISLAKIKKSLCAFTQKKIRNQPNTLIDVVTPSINIHPFTHLANTPPAGGISASEIVPCSLAE